MNPRATYARARTLSRADWRLLAEASSALVQARLLFARLPARDLIRRLSRDGPQGSAGAARYDDLSRMAWAIAAAANRLPWRTDCLIRCLAAETLLSRRDLTGQFHIGVSKSPDGALSAHAWMMCDGVSIAGGDGAEFAALFTPESPVPPPDQSHAPQL